ncbi:MAG TPA: tRNA lysidine(34) synthetase TilS [Candidatus Gastranaerophilales bacterium]|nr:tRNA lysidine(34) synthetase TilS [Candidatus Gastranaerophilales bacterium]
MENKSEKIKRKIINFLEKYKLLWSENFLLVGFSGGADSLCLLDSLHKISGNYAFKVAAAHLNHNWRGEDSLREAKKAELYCKKAGIEFFTETLSSELPQTEDEARKQRYIFFNKTAKKISAISILTGHTRTDNAETVLYRIIKGTGLIGLKGIPEIRKQENGISIYRPLLNDILRKDCIDYCNENFLSPSFDASNLNEKYLRNRIRHSLLPELRTYNKAVDDSILRLSSIAKESEEIIAEYIDFKSKNLFLEENIISAENFLKLSEPLKRRMLLNFLHKNEIEHTFERIEDLYNFINENTASKSGKTFSLGENSWFFVSSKELKIIDHTKGKKTAVTVPVSFEKKIFHPDLKVSIKIEKWTEGMPQKFPPDVSYTVYADLSRIKGDLFFRTRREGDIIQPFGMREKTKLKKYLINRGIPEYTRDELPLLATEKEILWVAGVGISELLRVNKKPSHIIKLCFT